jgi:opacity protein-like surface antigen
MGNAVVQFPTASSRIRPYAVDGIGLIHTKVTPLGNGFEIDEPSFGFNVGGGLIVFLNERVGLRGDFGYFRASRNDDATVEADALGVSELKFLRGTIGVTLKF